MYYVEYINGLNVEQINTEKFAVVFYILLYSMNLPTRRKDGSIFSFMGGKAMGML